MKNLIFFLPLLFLLCACTTSATETNEVITPQTSPTAIPFTNSPSPTLTIMLTATPDYDAKIGQKRLELQNLANTATLAVVTEQSIIKTSTALQGYLNGTATATTALGSRRATGTAAITATLVAQAVQTESAIQTATVQAPITQRLQVEADFEPVRQVIIVVGLVALILLVLWLLGNWGYQAIMLTYDKRLAVRGELTVAQPSQVNARLDQRDKSGFGSVDFTTIPVGEVVLREVARLLTSGSRYTQAQMTGSGRPLVKDASFDTFGEWMVKWGIAEQLEDGRYSIVRPEFFKQVLERG